MQNSPFPWLCSCTHMVVGHGTDRGVGAVELHLCNADPAPGSGASTGIWVPEASLHDPAQAGTGMHLAGLEPIFCSWTQAPVTLPTVCALRGSGFAVEPQSWSLL